MAIELNHETEVRLKRLAGARSTTPDAILREAVEQNLERNEQPTPAGEDRHPSGEPWPRRNPVGGIITPV